MAESGITVECCLICSGDVSCESQTLSDVRDNFGKTLFALKILLRIPVETYLDNLTLKVPGFCCDCAKGVVRARTIYGNICELVEEFNRVRMEFLETVKGKCKENWEGGDKKVVEARDVWEQIKEECLKTVKKGSGEFLDKEHFVVEDLTAIQERLEQKAENLEAFEDEDLEEEETEEKAVDVDLSMLEKNCESDEDFSQEDPLSILEWEEKSSTQDTMDAKEEVEVKEETDREDLDWDEMEEEHSEGTSEDEIPIVKKPRRAEQKTGKSWTCKEPDCKLEFTTFRAFKDHKNSIHKTAECPICHSKHADYACVRHHIKSVHKVQNVQLPRDQFSCPWKGCDKVLASKYSLRVHFSIHEGKPQYKCQLCERPFYFLSEVTYHKRKPCDMNWREKYTKCRPNPLQQGSGDFCPICKRRFFCLSLLQKHFSVAHPGEELMELNPASKKAENEVTQVTVKKNPISKATRARKPLDKTTPKQERKNLKNCTPSNELRIFQCDQCGAQLRTQTNLKVHVKTVHKRDYPYRCELCGHGFLYQSYLKVHVARTHKKREMYQCKVIGCRRPFAGKDQLDAHVAKDHGESGTDCKFQCTFCGKGFHQRNKFEQHEMIHTNQETRPFKCEINNCGKGFANQHNLRSHQLITHKAERKISRRKEVVPRSYLNKTARTSADK